MKIKLSTGLNELINSVLSHITIPINFVNSFPYFIKLIFYSHFPEFILQYSIFIYRLLQLFYYGFCCGRLCYIASIVFSNGLLHEWIMRADGRYQCDQLPMNLDEFILVDKSWMSWRWRLIDISVLRNFFF